MLFGVCRMDFCCIVTLSRVMLLLPLLFYDYYYWQYQLLKSQNAMYNHKWTQNKVRTIRTQMEKTRQHNGSRHTIISEKVGNRSSKCAACVCIFINCFMSRRYSMSLKHARFPARTACVCIYVYCLCQWEKTLLLPLMVLLMVLLLLSCDSILLLHDRRNICNRLKQYKRHSHIHRHTLSRRQLLLSTHTNIILLFFIETRSVRKRLRWQNSDTAK